jgi:hypothetical protein
MTVMLTGYIKSNNKDGIEHVVDCLRHLHFITLLFGLNGFPLWEGLIKRITQMTHDIDLHPHETPDMLCFDLYLCKQWSNCISSETLSTLILILRSNWWSQPSQTKEMMLKEIAHECFWSLISNMDLSVEKEEYSMSLIEVTRTLVFIE